MTATLEAAYDEAYDGCEPRDAYAEVRPHRRHLPGGGVKDVWVLAGER